MSLDRLLNVLVIITLIEMMVLVGLGVTFAELVDTGRNWRLVARPWRLTICSSRAQRSFYSFCLRPPRRLPLDFSSSRSAPARHSVPRLRELREPTCPWQSA